MSIAVEQSVGRPKLPLVVVLLALGTFLMSTTEFIIAGLLPEMAAGLKVGVAQAGRLITAFTNGVIVGGSSRTAAPLKEY